VLELQLPGEVDLRTVPEQIAAGEWFVHRQAGRLLVALRFFWAEPAFPGGQPDARLARYYREHGFLERGFREFEPWGPVALVEKVLTRKTPETEGLRGSA
jgi:hypothetical protein